MDRIVMHIDVNNAFLSWTAVNLLNNGYEIDIRNIPSVIAGDRKKRGGIVLAKSIPAKKLGINTPEPIFMAKRKCPNLQTFSPDYELYLSSSKKLFSIIREYTNEIEQFSIDECFLEYTSIFKKYGDPVKFAHMLKTRIYNELGFTVNIGVANNKLCAKMASDFEKPNKVHTLFSNEIKEKLWPLSVRDLFFVGKSTEKELNEIGIYKIKELAQADIDFLRKYFKNRAQGLIEYANGIDNSLIITEYETKSISNEITLIEDIDNIKDLLTPLRELSRKISLRLKAEDVFAYNIGVVLKNNKFQAYSHQKKLKDPINSEKMLFEEGKKLLTNMWKNESIRLIGLRTSDFVNSKNSQLSLFDKDVQKDQKIDDLIKKINQKYNKDIINYTDVFK